MRSNHSVRMVGMTSVEKSTVWSARVMTALTTGVAIVCLGLNLRPGLNGQTGLGLLFRQMRTLTSEPQAVLTAIQGLWCISVPTVYFWCTSNIRSMPDAMYEA